MDKHVLGWDDIWKNFSDLFVEGKLVKITARHKGVYKGITKNGEVNCYLSGKMQFDHLTANLPAVGDWCVAKSFFTDETNCKAAIIEQTLPRKSKIARVKAGKESDEQIIATNIDYCFIVTSANSDLNVNRLQRYQFLAANGGTTPVIILSKTDLSPDPNELAVKLKETFPEIQVILSSVTDGRSLDDIKALLKQGQTGIFIGSSGVGKSSLINLLLGEELQATLSIREADDKGRHATSGSSLFFMKDGGIIIDTAGLRELQLFGDKEGLQEIFPQIIHLASTCKFKNCSHSSESDCAILAALEKGELERKQFDNFLKLQKEMEYSKRKMDPTHASNPKKRWKKINIAYRKKKNMKERF